MGVVYRAQDKRMGRMVAIKTVTEDFSTDANMLERFYHEAEKTGRLKHPNIVTVYDLGDQDGSPYIVMEYVEGQSLEAIIRENRSIPLLEKLRIIDQVCAALGYAHQHDVIHRDVKPANVIVQPNGVAKLLDFGIARDEKRSEQGLTRTGSMIGTVPYMAPERLKGIPIDGRSDIFATGVMLYQTLTGELPFQGEYGVLVTKLLSEAHPPLGTYLQAYPAALDPILNRSLAKNPDDRYATAEDMALELFGVIDELKREHITDTIHLVKRHSASQQFVQARDALLQILKLDNQHTEARRLLNEVQQHLSRRQREEQCHNLSLEAEQHIGNREFDLAIELLEQALILVPDDRGVALLLEDTRQKQCVHERVERFLRSADEARSVGDLLAAKATLQQALELDPKDSRIQSAMTTLVRQLAEEELRAEARRCVANARLELKQRNFEAAIQMLREAEQLDPFQPELAELLRTATSAAQQEQRRKLLTEVEAEVVRAVTYEQSQRALVTIQSGLEKAPGDPVLLRLQGQMQRQIREFEARKLVEETVRECRANLESSPAEALRIVLAALEQAPGNEHLLALRASIDERMERTARDEQRVGYLRKAHVALAEGRLQDALAVLESCDAHLRSSEVTELLEFARTEILQQEQRRTAESTLLQAQQLLRDHRYSDAVDLLTPIVLRTSDDSLKSLLQQATVLHQSLVADSDAAYRSLIVLLQAEAFDEVFATLARLPKPVQATAQMAGIAQRCAAGQKDERARLAAVGTAYAQLVDADRASEWEPLAPAPPGIVDTLARTLELRRTRVANQRIEQHLDMLRPLLGSGAVPAESRNSADEILKRAEPLITYVDEDTRRTWVAIADQTRQRQTGGLRGKFTRKLRD